MFALHFPPRTLFNLFLSTSCIKGQHIFEFKRKSSDSSVYLHVLNITNTG